ncbi:MAG TPA: propionyl-CoA synthetase [Miltoncostaeaceae bacterium]|nr:propionyl-CoA synthetase [Miltoncostaeaceae bacterium]
MGGYDDVYGRWQRDPEGFWAEIAERITWERPPSTILDSSQAPIYRWFSDGRLNTCFNAVDRHADGGRGDQPALIYDSPVTGSGRTFTYRELQDATARVAGAIARLGVGRGDRVVIYMPMVPEAVITMLACARLGAVHSVVFGGFAAHELASRIDDCRPKLVVSASCGIEPARIVEYKPLLDRALALAGDPPVRCVILQRPQCEAALTAGRDLTWDEALEGAEPAPCVTVDATDPLYILYTSGTTGLPKGIVRDNGGHAVALNWSMDAVYDVRPGEVYWAASDIGWVVGHSYIVYAPLFAGCTTILYEGKPVGTPDAGAFWRVCAEHGVDTMFTAPTAIRAIKRTDPRGELAAGHDLSRLRTLFLAGERCDPDTLEWAGRLLDRPVIDHWWQTETGWPMAADCLGIEALPVKPGSPTKAVPGYDIQALGEDGAPLPAGDIGALCVRLPLPPGCSPTLWGSDERWIEAYLSRYKGWYLSGDAGYLDEDGYIYVMSRIDDVINTAGHRLSTGAMEEVLARHPDVAECAVVGVADTLKGQVPVGFVVLKAGVGREHDEIASELVDAVRDEIGPVASFKEARVVAALPKTRSGKVLRGTIRRMADGDEWRMPATIEDAGVLDEFHRVLADMGREPSQAAAGAGADD